ncbi:MAG: hypothetical protein ACI9TH_002081, partial [Kiritimatiellia bacterium]
FIRAIYAPFSILRCRRIFIHIIRKLPELSVHD